MRIHTTHARFIVEGALTELRYRYSGSVLGILWYFIQPLSLVAIFSIVFSSIMPSSMKLGGNATANLALYLSTGILPWFSFAEAVSVSAFSLVNNAHYLRKLPVPESLFAVKSALTTFLTLLVVLGLLCVFAGLSGLPPRVSWILLPLVALLLVTFGLGLGLVLAPIAANFRDITQGLPIALQLWMWLTPIIYTYEAIPPQYRFIADYNPASVYFDVIRSILIFGALPTLAQWLAMIAISATFGLAGVLFVKRLSDDIRDNL